MIKISTPNDVIRYAYGEITSPSEKLQIENSIASDYELSDLYFETMNLIKSLNRIKRKPSEQSINKILEFSKNYKLHTVP